jgi:hypothetical protein
LCSPAKGYGLFCISTSSVEETRNAECKTGILVFFLRISLMEGWMDASCGPSAQNLPEPVLVTFKGSQESIPSLKEKILLKYLQIRALANLPPFN